MGSWGTNTDPAAHEVLAAAELGIIVSVRVLG
jgi:hypothetical protein